jgi:hypothetical protein
LTGAESLSVPSAWRRASAPIAIPAAYVTSKSSGVYAELEFY